MLNGRNVENSSRCWVTSVSYFENLKVMGIRCIVPKTFDSFFFATFIGNGFRCNKYLAISEFLTTMLLIYFLLDVPPLRLENSYRNFSNTLPLLWYILTLGTNTILHF